MNNPLTRRGFLRVTGLAGAATALAACGTPGGSAQSGGTEITMFHWAGARGRCRRRSVLVRIAGGIEGVAGAQTREGGGCS